MSQEQRINEIKKSLYKENPTAEFIKADVDGLVYGTELKSGGMIFFKIPFTEVTGASFYPTMAAKLLNRWITLPTE